MTDRASILVAGLLVVAGCTAPTISGDDGSTDVMVTPAPVPTTNTEPAPRLAAGIGPTGIVDPMAVARAHEDALRNQPYRHVANLTVRDRSGTLVTSRTFVTGVSASHRIKRTVIHTAGPSAPVFGGSGSTVVWTIGSERVQVLDGPNGTRYRSLRSWEASPPALIAPPAGAVFIVATVVETNVTERTAGGALVVTGTRLRSRPFLASTAGVTDPRNAAFRAVITPTGLVRAYELRFSATDGGRPVRVSLAVRYDRVGDPFAGPPPPPVNVTAITG